MGVYDRSHPSSDRCRVTMETLKEQLYSLNMRQRLSLQNHDEEMRLLLEQEILDVRKRIEAMQAGDHNV